MGESAGRRRRRGFWRVVSVLSALVVLACTATLAYIGYEYWSAGQAAREVAEAAFGAGDDVPFEAQVNWAALGERNPDVIGWVRMPGTPIDYPIVQGDNDSEYLRKGFLGDAGGFVWEGAIFLSERNEPDFSDDNNFIYGHNMADGSMFAEVTRIAERPERVSGGIEFYVYTPMRTYRCMAYAAEVLMPYETEVLVPDLGDAEGMAAYVGERMDVSLAKAPEGVAADSFSKLFALVTCGNAAGTNRAVLYGGVVGESSAMRQ